MGPLDSPSLCPVPLFQGPSDTQSPSSCPQKGTHSDTGSLHPFLFSPYAVTASKQDLTKLHRLTALGVCSPCKHLQCGSSPRCAQRGQFTTVGGLWTNPSPTTPPDSALPLRKACLAQPSEPEQPSRSVKVSSRLQVKRQHVPQPCCYLILS